MATAIIGSVANGTAVIGLADVALRAGKDVYELLLKAKSARKDVAQLLEEIQLLEAAISLVLACAETYQAQCSTVEDHRRLEILLDLVAACGKIFGELRLALGSKATSQTDSWFRAARKSLEWALSEKDIANYCLRIERLKSSTHLTLSAFSGERLNGVAHNVANIQGCLANGFQNVAHTVDTTAIATAMSLQDLKQSTSSSHIQVVTMNEEILDTTREINSAVFGVQKVQTTQFTNLQRMSTRSTSAVLNRISRSSQHLKAVQSEVHKNSIRVTRLEKRISQLAELTLSENQDHQSILGGTNLHSVVGPLLLIKPHLTSVFMGLLQSVPISLSHTQVAWLRSELESLLAAGHRAAVVDDGYDVYNRRQAQNRLRKRTQTHSQHEWADWSSTPAKAWLYSSNAYETHSYQTAAGCLQIWIDATQNHQQPNLTQENSFRILLQFIPKRDLYMQGFRLAIAKSRHGLEPCISRVLQSWNVIPSHSEALLRAWSGDVDGLRQLFETKKASPFDRTESGKSLLDYFSFFVVGLGRDSRERHVPNQALQVTYCGIAMDIAIQLLEMFLGRGAGFDDDLCSFLGRVWEFANEKGVNAQSLKEFMNVFNRAGVDNEIIGNIIQQAFHQTAYTIGSSVLHRNFNAMLKSALMLGFGVDLERRTADGETVLLVQAMQPKFEFMEALVSNGADVQAVDNVGQGFLHCLIVGGAISNRCCSEINIFGTKFMQICDLMMMNGCEIDGKNMYGTTVSQYALHVVYGCFFATWIKVLSWRQHVVIIDQAHFTCQECFKACKTYADFPTCRRCLKKGGGYFRLCWKYCLQCKIIISSSDLIARDDSSSAVEGDRLGKDNLKCPDCGEWSVDMCWHSEDLEEEEFWAFETYYEQIYSDPDYYARKILKLCEERPVRMLVVSLQDAHSFWDKMGLDYPTTCGSADDEILESSEGDDTVSDVDSNNTGEVGITALFFEEEEHKMDEQCHSSYEKEITGSEVDTNDTKTGDDINTEFEEEEGISSPSVADSEVDITVVEISTKHSARYDSPNKWEDKEDLDHQKLHEPEQDVPAIEIGIDTDHLKKAGSLKDLEDGEDLDNQILDDTQENITRDEVTSEESQESGCSVDEEAPFQLPPIWPLSSTLFDELEVWLSKRKAELP